MRLLLAFAVLGASSAWADRIVLRAFTGKGAAALRGQLESALCARLECVAEQAVARGKKLDPKKLRAQQVDVVLGGDVKAKGKSRTLTLTVEPAGGAPKRYGVPLGKAATLTDSALADAIAAVRTLGGLGAAPAPTPAAPPPSATAQPARPAAEEPEPEASVVSPPPMRFDAPPPLPEAVRKPTDGPAPRPPGRSAQAKRYPVLVAELGLAVLHRTFEYQGLTTNNLRAYELPVFPLGLLHGSFAPLALLRQDALAGLSAQVDWGTSPFLVTRLAPGGDAYPTAVNRLQAGLAWRLAPFAALPLTFVPAVGFHLATFSVGSSAAGARLDGLPNPELLGLGVALGLELKLLDGLLTALLQVGLNPYFSGGELFSTAYFPSGRALGLDVRAGVAVRVLGPLSVAGRFELSSASLSLGSLAGDAYVAQSASDVTLGGSLAVRMEL